METLEHLKYWDLVKEICPPRQINYVVHTVHCGAGARASDLSTREMVQSIIAIGLIAPEHYSNLTENIDTGWGNSEAKQIDIVFLTETNPTQEAEDVVRDSAAHGFVLREAVSLLAAAEVPQAVKNLYPPADRYVRVPPQDLQAIITWKGSENREQIFSQINKIAEQVVQGHLSENEGTGEIWQLLAGVPMDLYNQAEKNEVIVGLSTNCIQIKKRRERFLKLQHDFMLGKSFFA